MKQEVATIRIQSSPRRAVGAISVDGGGGVTNESGASIVSPIVDMSMTSGGEEKENELRQPYACDAVGIMDVPESADGRMVCR